jgi:hypothetical protein
MLNPSDDAFLEDLERRAFRFFWESAHADTGLIPDRARADGTKPGGMASVAAAGFGLTALAIGCADARQPDVAHVARPGAARARVLVSLHRCGDLRAGVELRGVEHRHGAGIVRGVVDGALFWRRNCGAGAGTLRPRRLAVDDERRRIDPPRMDSRERVFPVELESVFGALRCRRAHGRRGNARRG